MNEQNQVQEHKVYDFSDYSAGELEAHIRKAEQKLKNQEHIVKAATAYSRLVKGRDFGVILQHLQNTVTQITLDAPKRNAESQVTDRQIAAAIATTLSLIEDLPAVGNKMGASITDTKDAISQLKAAL